MVARARRTALKFLVLAIATSILVGWGASTLVVFTVGQPFAGDRGTVALWLAVAQLAVLAVLVVMAYVLNRMNARFIDGVIRQEDRVMRAVAHEVRTPVTRLLVVAEEGLTAGGDPAGSLRDVVEEAEALTELIDDLAESIRVMAGDIPVGRAAVRLDETVRNLPDRTRLGEAEIRVETEPVTITGNPRLLRLAVINLVRNAVQHAYGGGPGVVVVRADRRGVSVLDDGSGMDPARITEIMANPRVAMSRGFAGLGFPLANWVAEIHGGRMALANRPEGGLEARLELPVDPADPGLS